jgi:hypothetical protein
MFNLRYFLIVVVIFLLAGCVDGHMVRTCNEAEIQCDLDVRWRSLFKTIDAPSAEVTKDGTTVKINAKSSASGSVTEAIGEVRKITDNMAGRSHDQDDP